MDVKKAITRLVILIPWLGVVIKVIKKNVKQGRTRLVILIPRRGIAIKVAKIDFFKGLEALLIKPIQTSLVINCFMGPETPLLERMQRLFKAFFKSFWNNLTAGSIFIGSLQFYWFRGINANWQEFWFYLTTRHPLLQPTYFSFFGLFNIQKAGMTPLKPDTENQFYSLSNGKARGHHFDNHENFCLDDNRLKILDYGDWETQEVILTEGEGLLNFDPDWDYEEYKKQFYQPSYEQKTEQQIAGA